MKVRINDTVRSSISDVLKCRGKTYKVERVLASGMLKLIGNIYSWYPDEVTVIPDDEKKTVNFFIGATEEINKQVDVTGLTDDEITEKYKEWIMDQEFAGWYEV